MAKIQKSVLLPEGLHDLCKDREDRTGTTFTRQVIAAMLEFFFSDSDGPQQPWIQLLMAVERGEIPIDKVPIEYCEWQVEYYQKLEEHAKEEDFTDQIGYARYMRKAAEQDLACWRQREAEHGSTIRGFIEDGAWLRAKRTEAQKSDRSAYNARQGRRLTKLGTAKDGKPMTESKGQSATKPKRKRR